MGSSADAVAVIPVDGDGCPMFVIGFLGAAEILILFIVFGCIFGWLAWESWMAHRSPGRRRRRRQLEDPVQPSRTTAYVHPEESQALIANLTQRFCPQCRAPLGTDSPEGL